MRESARRARACVYARAHSLARSQAFSILFSPLLAESERHRLAVDGVYAGVRTADLPCHVALGQERTAGLHGGGLLSERAGCLA